MNTRTSTQAQQGAFDLDIPNTRANPPDLDIFNELQGAIALALKKATRRGLSREHIVERMNLCLPDLDKPITLRQLNAWTARSKEYSEFPYRYLPAFCWATDCYVPLNVGPSELGFELIDSDDAKALELGRIALARAGLQQQERALKR